MSPELQLVTSPGWSNRIFRGHPGDVRGGHPRDVLGTNICRLGPSCILSQYLWYNRSIQVDNASVYFLKPSKKTINYVSQLFCDNGSIKQWNEFKREHNLHESFYFQWLQLIDLIPQRWKIIIKGKYEDATNLVIHDHYLVKGSRVITLDKLTSTEIHSILISKAQNKLSSNIYSENLYND